MKRCEYCSSKLIWCQDNSWESIKAFHKRKFCNKSCKSQKKSVMFKRNEQIINMYETMTVREIAKQTGITNQRVSQILQEAEERGELDRKDLTLQRKRQAIMYADQFNKFSEKYRPHLGSVIMGGKL